MKRVAVFLMLVTMIAVALAGVAPTATRAQDDAPASPLHALLALVPEAAAEPRQDDARWSLSIRYADIRAIDAARPGVPTFDTWADLDAVAGDTDVTHLWYANLMRLAAGPPYFNPLLFDAGFDDMYGFDSFDIDRALTFGLPSQEAVVYGGEFDLAAIEAAFTVRTYEPHTINGVEIWCGPVGCENGQQPGNWLPDQNGPRDPDSVVLPGRYPIFGGHLGRQEPIALLPGAIANTPDWDVMQAITLVISGAGKSVLDVPEFRALADTVTGMDVPLLQVWYLHPLEFVGADVALTLAQRDPAQDWTPLLERYADGIPTPDALPHYDLAALVDWQEGVDQVHGVVAVYRDEETANRASEELTSRIANMVGWTFWNPESLITWETIEATMDPPRVIYHAGTDRWIAIASAQYPIPSSEPEIVEGMPSFLGSGLLYSLWVQSYYTGLFTPLYLTEADQD